MVSTVSDDMTRSDDVINEDGHGSHSHARSRCQGYGCGTCRDSHRQEQHHAAAANVMFTFALDTKAKRSMFNMPHEETPKASNSTCPSSLRPPGE